MNKIILAFLLLFPIAAFANGTSGTGTGTSLTNSSSSGGSSSGGGGSTAISGLTNGTATNSIDSTLFSQTWNWSTLTTQTGLSLTASNATTGQALSVVGNSSLAGTTTISNLAVNAFAAPQTALQSLIGQPPYYAANYGIVFDGIYLQDVNTTASSTSVTSTSHTFTSADNNKLVSVYGGLAITTTGTTTSGSNLLTSVASETGASLGVEVVGTGIPTGTKVVSCPGASTIVVCISKNATASATIAVTWVPFINTTISSTSGGAATLAATMSATVTGTRMYFGTDSTTAMNALDATVSTAGGGVIVLPQGAATMSNSWIIDNNVSMRGLGAGNSVLKWITTSDQTTPMIESRAQASAMVCNLANATNFQNHNEFRYFELDDEAAPAVTNHVSAKGFGFSCTANSLIDHTFVHDTPATGIATDSGFPTTVSFNTVINAGRGPNATGQNGIGEGLVAGGGDSYLLVNNVVINPRHYGIFVESQASGVVENSNVVIDDNIIIAGLLSASTANSAIGNAGAQHFTASGNTVEGNASQFAVTTATMSGISSDGGTTTQASGTNTLITGNTIDNMYWGVGLAQSTTSGGSPVNAVVSGNVITNSKKSGIRLDSFASAAMDNININGNTIYNSGYSGIWAPTGQGLTHLSITNNIINNNGTNGGATDYIKAAIGLGISTTGLVVTGNQIFDNGSGSQKYAVSLATGVSVANALISDNNFIGTATPFNIVSGTLSGIIKNNQGEPTFTLSGGCSSTTPVGTGINGTYASGTTGSCSTVVNAFGNASIVAPHGYNCFANDLTTNSDILNQIASTTTGATISGTTVSADTISFGCTPF